MKSFRFVGIRWNTKKREVIFQTLFDEAKYENIYGIFNDFMILLVGC